MNPAPRDKPSVLSAALVAEAVIDGATLIATALVVEDAPPAGNGIFRASQLPR